MRNRRNYYRILHVQPDAPAAIVKASYRTLMQKLKAHPDLGGDIANAQLLNEAYAVISNPDKRTHYDSEFHLKSRHKETEKSAHRETSPKVKPRDQNALKKPPTMRRRASLRCKFCNTSQPSINTHAVNAIALHSPAQCISCSSPLSSIETLNLNASCKRTISRIEREGAIEFFTQWPQATAHRGIITDISPNGLGFKSSTRLKYNTTIKVNSLLLNAVIRIVNHRQIGGNPTKQYQFGAEFLAVEFPVQQGNFFSRHV